MKPETELAILILLAAFAWVVLLRRTIGLLYSIYDSFRRKRVYPSIIKMKEKNLCALHNCNQVFLAMEGIPPERHKVCLECGSIAGTKKAINAPAIEVYKATVKARVERQKLYAELLRQRQVKLDAAMNRLIKDFYETRDKVEFLQQFFRKSVIEIDKINDEVAGELNEPKQ